MELCIQSLNPPIRGSIVTKTEKSYRDYIVSQSPYKGFNRREEVRKVYIQGYQSPYKGFNRTKPNKGTHLKNSINPPIRGSIEQDNALFRNYKHKR